MRQTKYLHNNTTCRIDVDYEKQSISIENRESKGEKIASILHESWIYFAFFFIFLLAIFYVIYDGYTIKKISDNGIDEIRLDYGLVYIRRDIFFDESLSKRFIGYISIGSILLTISAFLTGFNKLLSGNYTKLTSPPKYFMEFRGKQNKKVLELPLFTNTCLLYQSKGDYAAYLQRIKIRELPVYYIKKKRKHGRRVNKRKKSFKFWKASFIFSKEPKEGYLKIRFN